jgi:transcriptional regulator with XRE-family HTH domain
VAKSANLGNYETTAAEFLRALRGERSQRALARRLGYRRNPVTDWENKRRFPTGEEALRVARASGVNVKAALTSFHHAPLLEGTRGVYDVPTWLDALRGSTPTKDLAARAGVSRFAMGRWLRGDARPRLPHFFSVIDAATGRLPDLVAALVPMQRVPSLRARYQASQAARRAAYDAPWTEAILRVLESTSYRALPSHDDEWIARRLGIGRAEVRQSLDILRRAGAVRRLRGLYRVSNESTVDTRGDPARVAMLLAHWSQVAATRLPARLPTDLFAYNVFSLSTADYQRARELLRNTFREIRSLVAASEPVERVALLNVQLLTLDAGAEPA